MARTNLKLAAGVVAGLGMLSGAALAAGPVEEGTITGCYAKSAFLLTQKGELRVVDSPSDCRSNEMVLTWSREGAEGLQGPAGPEGPQGPVGPEGPPGAFEGEAGGDLTGTYPDPEIAGETIVPDDLSSQVFTDDLVRNTAHSWGPYQIAPDAIDRSKIADQAVGSDQINVNAVRSPQIAPGAVREQELEAPAAWQDIELAVLYWDDFGDGNQPQCYRDLFGVVHLRGMASNFEEAELLPIGTIPCGGPAHLSYFQATRLAGQFQERDSSAHTVQITPNGDMFDFDPALPANSKLVLDGISYPTH